MSNNTNKSALFSHLQIIITMCLYLLFSGYLVLKDLGFKVEAYVASEICEDSLAVAVVNHDGKINHIGDARFITREHVRSLSVYSHPDKQLTMFMFVLLPTMFSGIVHLADNNI